MDFKMPAPSPSASLLKAVIPSINGMCAVHPFERSIAAQLCITLEPPTTLTDQSYRIFSGILKSNTS